MDFAVIMVQEVEIGYSSSSLGIRRVPESIPEGSPRICLQVKYA